MFGGILVTEKTKELYDIKILEIPTNTNYWFVRAQGGKFYDDFLENNFIAIDDNDLSIENLELDLENVDGININSVENIKEIYKKYYPNFTKQQNTLYSKRLFNFYYEMEENDVVVVPSKISEKFIIGVVTSGPYDMKENNRLKTQNQFNYRVCPFIKRRNVSWIKEITRSELPETMYWVLSAHQSFFNLNKYSESIDSLFAPIYKKGSQLTSIFHVDQKTDISFDNWYTLQKEFKDITKSKSSEFSMKIDVQSPGEFKVITGQANIDFLLNIGASIVDYSVKNPVESIAAGVTLYQSLFANVAIGSAHCYGLFPYFFGEGKIDRKRKKLENESIELDNEQKKENIKEQKIQTKRTHLKLKKEIKEMSITYNDPGRLLSEQNSTDPDYPTDQP